MTTAGGRSVALRRAGVRVLGVWGMVAMWTAPVQACVGNCNGDTQVSVDEILKMVDIALGNAAVTDCSAGDANVDDHVTVNEIVLAIDAALNGCPVCGNGIREADEMCDGADAAQCPGACIPAGAANACTCPSGPPDLRGSFNLSGVTTVTGCLDPGYDGNALFSGTFTFTAQNGSSFSGTLTAQDPFGGDVNGTVNGSITASGHVTGTFQFDLTYSGEFDSTTQGSFDGQLTGNSLSISYSAHDIVGDTCSSSGTLSGSR